MHQLHIPQCSIQNRNVNISILNGTLWDTEQVHYGICEIGLLPQCQWNKPGHYNDVIMGMMASQITSLTIFTQPFIQAQIKENIKAPHHWPLWGEFTCDGEFPAQMASNAENVSICCHHDFHITSPQQNTTMHKQGYFTDTGITM